MTPSPIRFSRSARPEAACTRRNQRGNALLYTLLALVVGGIGLAVGVGQYQDAERSTSVQATVAEIHAIVGGAKQNFGQYSYANLTTQVAIGSQVIPQTMVAGAAATNRFGGAVDLVGDAAAGTATLTYAGVPANVCTNIVNGTQALARQINVAGAAVKPLDGVVNVANLTTQCTSGGATGVAVVWTIGRT
jgi:hypothetical protein